MRSRLKFKSLLFFKADFKTLLHPAVIFFIFVSNECLTEILGALISVVSIWIVTGVLVYLAIERVVKNDFEIEGHVMLITSGCAVVVNIM